MSNQLLISASDQMRVFQGLGMLLRLDAYLMKNNLAERSITHKLAEHYQYLFNEWNVDCEYNRNLGKPKEIVIEPREILKQMADKIETNEYFQSLFHRQEEPITKEEMQELERQLREPKLEYIEELDVVLFVLSLPGGNTRKETIFPDIIIHHRGTKDNHIVFEVKKSINRVRMARAYDLVKLITLTSSPDFNYRLAYFIDLPVGNELLKFKHFSLTRFCKKVYKIIPLYI